jgi:uncharacterized lipoprotein YddW (UPF0748 family)
MWVVRDALITPDDIDRCVDLATQARFHMLFVQVRGRGDAYYQSSLEPPARDLRYPIGDFDPLMYLLAKAHSSGISVHAWLNVFYVWSNGEVEPPEGHVTLSHPEWLITDVSGLRMDERPVDEWKASGIEGYFLSPFSTAVRKHTADVVRDLVDRYAVDGIHLDYVRFPGPGFGFDIEVRTKFALEWGIDPVLLKEDQAGMSAVMGNDAVAALDSVWIDWRAQQVDSVVIAIREAAGDLPLSAAVIPDPVPARVEKGQDWSSWIHRRLVDFVVPMAYNYRPEEILDWVRILHNTVGREKMLVGLAIYDGRDAYIDRTVNVLRIDSVSGFSIFSYNVLAERRFAANFIEGIFFPGGLIDQ